MKVYKYDPPDENGIQQAHELDLSIEQVAELVARLQDDPELTLTVVHEGKAGNC